MAKQKGMGLGAVMALIIGGGASMAEVILLKSMFRLPMIIAFLAIIPGMAILVGYFFQFIHIIRYDKIWGVKHADQGFRPWLLKMSGS